MSLCTVCSAIPFERLFGSENSPRIHEVGELKHAKFNTRQCRLCAFWVESYELAYPALMRKRARTHRNVRMRLQICSPSDDEAQETEEPWFERAGIWAWKSNINTGPCMWLRFYTTQVMNEAPRDPLICISCLPEQEELRRTAKLMPRIRSPNEINTRRLNYEQIRVWLWHCSSNHRGECQRSTVFKRQTLNLRLINVETRQIERVTDQRQYVALSYVWGPQHGDYSLRFWQSCANEDGIIKLPETLPNTIEDALTLAQRLGFNHAWIDAFCIDQSNEDEVKEQLANMNVVFECAFLVIAAMDSSQADAGIRGVSKDLTRLAQPRTRIPYGDFAATYVTDIWKEQGKSPWEQRAWTLQELLLAKRILLLHSEYTVMRCQEGIFNGLLEADDDYFAAEFTQSGTHFWDNGFDVELNKLTWDFGNFDNFLANYTRRQLTKTDDILNACLGALSQITRNTGVGFIQGLPRADLHSGLLWKPHHLKMLSRRTGFPSWTWAGWKGRIEHHYCIDDLAIYDALGPAERQKYIDEGGSIASESALSFVSTLRDAFVIDQGDQSSELRLSSQVMDVNASVVRQQGKPLLKLPKNSEQSKLAVGDHWVIMDRDGQPLANLVGEVARFEATDYSFQTDLTTSAELRRRGGDCKLVYVKYFPHLRDTAHPAKDNWLFDQVGCLVVLDNDPSNSKSTVTRIGALFIRLQDWLDLERRNEVVTLV